MNGVFRHLAIGLLVGQFAFTPVSLAVESSTQDADRKRMHAEARAEDLKEVLAELELAADFLAAQQNLYFEAALGYDVLQANGQKLEFGGSRKITMRRPDRARVHAESREGTEVTLFFDGKSISIDLADENAYVSVESPDPWTLLSITWRKTLGFRPHSRICCPTISTRTLPTVSWRVSSSANRRSAKQSAFTWHSAPRTSTCRSGSRTPTARCHSGS